MSHSFLDFSDFDGAWRYSSAASIATATPIHFLNAGTPALIRIRTPVTGSLNLEKPLNGSITRRRTMSDATPLPLSLTAEIYAAAGAHRPISAILVSFARVDWNVDKSAHPHLGRPADLPQEGTEDLEAVSPKSELPRALQNALRKQVVGLSVQINEPEQERRARLGSSLVAVKSPYVKSPYLPRVSKLRAWIRRVVGKFRQ